MLLLLSHHHLVTGVSSLFWWKHAALLAAALPSLRVLFGHVQTPPGFGTMIGSLYKRLSGSLSCTGLFPAGSEVFEQLSVCRLQLVLPLLPGNCEPRDKRNKCWGGEFREILKLCKCYPEQVSCLLTFLRNRWVNNYTGRKPHDWKTALEF